MKSKISLLLLLYPFALFGHFKGGSSTKVQTGYNIINQVNIAAKPRVSLF